MAALQFGPVLGGSLALVNLRLPLFVASGLAGGTWLLLLYYLVDPEQRPRAPPKSGSGEAGATSGSEHLRTRRIVVLLAAIAMFSITALSVCLPIILADKFGLNPNEIGLLQWGDGMVLLIGNQIYTRVCARHGVPAAALLGA
eukprot:7386444-Prymnesium_polylepis.1